MNLKSIFKGNKNIDYSNQYGEKKFSYYIKPTAAAYLNAIDKPFAMKIAVEAGVKYDFLNGFFMSTAFTHPLYNSIKDIKPEGIPTKQTKFTVHSDVFDYLRYDKTQMKKLSLDYLFKLPDHSFGKVEVGYLNKMYAGIDLEYFKPFENDRFGVGLEYQKVYKRKVDNFTGVYSDLNYDAKFLNIYYYLYPKYQTHLNLKVGQFLASDKGVKVNIERNYKRFSFGVYATVTNSSKVFHEGYNSGYVDKGIYIKVPLEVFTYENKKERVKYGISPWSRDVGQYADTTYNLSDMLNNENNINDIIKNINLIGN